jgi:DNA-binding MarR family transcriptional regulator
MTSTAYRLDAVSASLELPDVLQFMQVLWAVVHGLEKTSKRMNADLGLTGPQRLVLRVVGLFPGLSAGDLAAILHVHPSTLTGVLKRLVGQGRIERIDDPSDRRRAVLRLAPRGARANAVSHGTVEAAVARALDGVTERDGDAARRVLERIAQQLASTPLTEHSRERRRRSRASSRRRAAAADRP